MKLYTFLYQVLVNRIPVIQKQYHKLRDIRPDTYGRIYAWAALVWMNLCWLCGDRKLEKKMYQPDEQKRGVTNSVESEISTMVSPHELAQQLLTADIISFDIFDTLIFRPVKVPSDLFFFVGEKLHFMDFERIRREAETRVRQRRYKENGSYEVTLDQIYEEIEYETGMDKWLGMQTEIDMERKFCYANPYMKEVYRIVKEQTRGTTKKLICVSDMYLPSEVLRDLLSQCGYMDIDKIFVSCEERGSKAEGGLYRNVMKAYGMKSYIHIGDNLESDGKRAKENGWRHIYYPNVNLLGLPYRAEDMSVLTGTLYGGVVNGRIHNGLVRYTSNYEWGYIYGGLFTMGYCQFVHDYVESHDIDKILFLSRDGEILYKVYQFLYGEFGSNKKKICETQYVYWSRTVAVKLLSKYDRHDFLRRFVDHKVNKGNTLNAVFEAMQIMDMLNPFCNEMSNKKCEMQANTILTDKNVGMVRKYLLTHWPELEMHYVASLEAGKKYYGSVLKNQHKVAVVDVGWAGSGALALDTLVNHEWGLNCEIVGIVAGTNTFHNAEPNATEPFFYTGKLISYMYSQENNRENWKWHNPSKNHNMLVELLLSSKEGSLVDIVLDSVFCDGYRFVFKKPDVDAAKVEEIQRGIMDFAKDYCRYIPEEYQRKHHVSGSDAYAVLRMFLRSEVGTELEEGI